MSLILCNLAVMSLLK